MGNMIWWVCGPNVGWAYFSLKLRVIVWLLALEAWLGCESSGAGVLTCFDPRPCWRVFVRTPQEILQRTTTRTKLLWNVDIENNTTDLEESEEVIWAPRKPTKERNKPYKRTDALARWFWVYLPNPPQSNHPRPFFYSWFRRWCSHWPHYRKFAGRSCRWTKILVLKNIRKWYK